MMAFGTLLGGVGSLLSGASTMMGMFKKQKGTMITGSGQGRGFWNFFSKSNIAKIPISADDVHVAVDEYFNTIITDPVMKKTLMDDKFYYTLHSHLQYRSYVLGECFNAMNTVRYDKNSGKLFFYIYTLSPVLSEVWGETKKVLIIESMGLEINFDMAKDWMIVTHMKTNFMKGYIKDEFKYIDEKSIRMDDVVEAIGIAMAPAYLGLIKVPEQFVQAMNNAFLKESKEAAKEPSPELKSQATQIFSTLVQNQQQMNQQTQDGLQKLADDFHKDQAEQQKKEQESKAKQAQQAQAQNSYVDWDYPKFRPRRPRITKKQY